MVARCTCGWECEPSFSGMVAALKFRDHQEKTIDDAPSIKPKKYWVGDPPTRCDLTGAGMPGTHDDMDVFVYGRTQMGPWGNMCMSCHEKHGMGLGLGRGQKYVKQEDGRWLKVAG